jgi:hypothetical protein
MATKPDNFRLHVMGHARHRVTAEILQALHVLSADRRLGGLVPIPLLVGRVLTRVPATTEFVVRTLGEMNRAYVLDLKRSNDPATEGVNIDGTTLHYAVQR